MGRRLVLLGFMNLIDPGSVWQLTFAMTFSLLYTVIQLQANPYRDETDGYLAVCASACITMILMRACPPLERGTPAPRHYG